jgi:Protein of unknown function with PCYCGC motif
MARWSDAGLIRKVRVPTRPKIILAFAVLVLLGGSFGCSGASAPASPDLAMAPMAQMPSSVQQAPVTVQQAYQFAVANSDLMKQVACYCGCGKVGHKSNYDCYVSGVDAAGKFAFDQHALGCSICIDITQDAMRLLRQGKSVADISRTIDTAFAKYGPSNMAPPQ